MSAQADLLSYFGQQLIAHGAVLFAILAAAFTFIGRMRPNNQNPWRTLIYIFVAGFLIGAGFYTLGRMLWYGALVDSVMRTHACRCQDLWSYFLTVVDNTKTRLASRGLFYPFISLFSASLNYWPPVACLCAGFSIALLIYLIEPVYGFMGRHTHDRVILMLSFLFLVVALAIIASALVSWI
jgi:hypothetical protein